MKYGTSEYNDVTPVGKIVLLKKLKPTLERHYGDIVVPYITNKNTAIGVAKIVKLGNKITNEDGINVDDYVMYDYYSVFEDGPEYVITRSENIFMKVTEEEAKEISR